MRSARSPQIAYAVAPLVEGWLALARATADDRYAMFAGLTARWFVGDNVAGVPLYDPASGRTFDGIDGPGSVNRNAGGESTVEALLALGEVAADPVAAEHFAYRRKTPLGASLAEAPSRVEYEGPGPDGGRVVLVREPNGGFRLERTGAPITLTYWPAANPVEVRLAERLAAAYKGAAPMCTCACSRSPRADRPRRCSSRRSWRGRPRTSARTSRRRCSRASCAPSGVVRLDRLGPTRPPRRARERADARVAPPP